MPLPTLRLRPRGSIARLRVKMEFAFSFLVRLFHPLQHAGLSRRTPRWVSNLYPFGLRRPPIGAGFSVSGFRKPQSPRLFLRGWTAGSARAEQLNRYAGRNDI